MAALTAKQAAIAERLWRTAQRGRPIPAELREVLPDPAVAQSAATFARRTILLLRSEVKSIPVGTARRGGAPDLPTKIGWPEVDGALLSFVLQVPVEDVLLSLFVGQGAEHQLLAVDPGSLQRRPVPSKPTWRVPELGLLAATALESRGSWALPPVGADEYLAIAHRHPELDEANYAQAVERLRGGATAHVNGFALRAFGVKKLRPLLAVSEPAVDVLWPATNRFGRGVVRGTVRAS